MCFTKGMGTALAAGAFALAAYEWKRFKCPQYSIGIAYWGVMEVLQTLQHFYAASPDDNYAMCKSRMNNALTSITSIDLVFQPLFVSMLVMSMYRRYDLTARIEADLIWRMCFLFAIWFMRYVCNRFLLQWKWFLTLYTGCLICVALYQMLKFFSFVDAMEFYISCH